MSGETGRRGDAEKIEITPEAVASMRDALGALEIPTLPDFLVEEVLRAALRAMRPASGSEHRSPSPFEPPCP